MPRLSDFPAGGAIFVDANIFLEHLLSREPTCVGFFHRVQASEITGVTSVVVLAEVRHRLLLTEAVRQGYVAEAKRAIEVMRSRPEILAHLSNCDRGLNLLLELPLRVVSVTMAQFRTAQRLSIRHRLLTNDALHLAVLRAHRFGSIATADRDFLRVPHLTVWSP